MSGITERYPLAHVRSPAQRLVSSPPSRLIPLRLQTSGGIEIPKIGSSGGRSRDKSYFCNYSWESHLLSHCGPTFDKILQPIDLRPVGILDN